MLDTLLHKNNMIQTTTFGKLCSIGPPHNPIPEAVSSYRSCIHGKNHNFEYVSLYLCRITLSVLWPMLLCVLFHIAVHTCRSLESKNGN